jgi:hypothetical protein
MKKTTVKEYIIAFLLVLLMALVCCIADINF